MRKRKAQEASYEHEESALDQYLLSRMLPLDEVVHSGHILLTTTPLERGSQLAEAKVDTLT